MTSPGDGLRHPVALASLALLVVNDHFLKTAWPGLVTGKLSDVAGLVFFPLFLQGLWELGARLRGRAVGPSRRVLCVAAGLTGVVFALVKLTAVGGEVYRVGLGLLQWPVRALASGGGPARVTLVRDATDLWALPALLLSVACGWRRSQSSS
jgi:hypothetical protein